MLKQIIEKIEEKELKTLQEPGKAKINSGDFNHDTLIKEDSDYEKFFKNKMKKYGVKSTGELNKSQKKKFFDEIEKEWTEDEND